MAIPLVKVKRKKDGFETEVPKKIADNKALMMDYGYYVVGNETIIKPAIKTIETQSEESAQETEEIEFNPNASMSSQLEQLKNPVKRGRKPANQ